MMSATNCKCIRLIERQMKKNNPDILRPLMLEVDGGTGRTFSTIAWLSKSCYGIRDSVHLAHTFCPFCGKRYKYGDGIPGLDLDPQPAG
jgi:hypothetical protein